MALQNSNTYSNWAHQISLLSSRIISKQGLCERMGKPAVKLALSLLEKQVKQAYQTVRSKDLFAQFKRVLIQDSTTLNLPKELANQFPGNKAKGRQRAVARIQSVYDLIHNRFCFFGLHSYVENDQSAAMQLIHYLKAGDLLIRDLGYFTLISIENIIKRHAYFLSRLPHNVSIFDLQSKEKLDILKLLKGREFFDGWVFIGNETHLKVRLVVVRTPEQIARERRRRARNHADKRFTYSSRYLKLLDYTFYITNVDVKTWEYPQVHTAYRIRWKVEIIFKSWKSYFHIDKLIHKQCCNYNRVQCTIFLMLLFITLFQLKLYHRFEMRIKKKYQRQISLLKLAKMVSQNILFILSKSICILDKYLLQNCCYECRSDRSNINQLSLISSKLT